MTIVLPFDGAKHTEIRAKMPEPSRVEFRHFFTKGPINVSFSAQLLDQPAEFPEDEWVKVLVNDRGAQFWAWKHLASDTVYL